MTDNHNRLTQIISSKLELFGYKTPTRSVIYRLLEIAFFASIKTEENRFVRGSMTYSNPAKPEIDPPPRRRADYPSFTSFGKRTALNASKLVKLSRAVDMWTGSIAVYGTSASKLFAWGIVDQQVHTNTRLHQEASSGFRRPGILTINIEGVGDISVYHANLFIGRLKQNQLIEKESDALHSDFLYSRLAPILEPYAVKIEQAAKNEEDSALELLVEEWSTSVARICIGLRRLGTGGSLLFTSKPQKRILDIINYFPYRRLGDATVLKVLDSQYSSMLYKNTKESSRVLRELQFAETDEEDRADELTGAVKIVTSLAAIDGLVLLDLTLGVIGFGVKIKSGSKIGTVFDGPDFIRKGVRAKKIDIAEFGTRHGSMLRYCQADKNAIGIVISQDGHVRLIASANSSLTLWDNVKLLHYDDDSTQYAKKTRETQRRRSKLNFPHTLGYSAAPKTIDALFKQGKNS